MFLYEITHRYLKNDYQFFDTLKTKCCKIRGTCNLLIKVKFHKLGWSFRLSYGLQIFIDICMKTLDICFPKKEIFKR